MMIYLPYDDDDDDDDDDLPAMTSFLQSANRLKNQTFLPPVMIIIVNILEVC